MTLSSMLGSETGLTLVTSVLGGLWATFKASDWRRQAQGSRYEKALQALEAGVEVTYRTYVQAIKEAREDGRLTEEEARQARQRARNAAIDYGRRQGVDVVSEVGAEYIDLWIAKLVKKLKQ